ncbi:MAG: prepilin-type N-terminal cleavage/methylation domain-containing protein [bacterium]
MKRSKSFSNYNSGKRKSQFSFLGFTLLELLITMAVISIIAVFSVPRVDRWLKRIKIKDASSTLALDFAKARSLARTVKTENDDGAFNPFTTLVQRPSQAALSFREDGYSIILRRDANTVGGWDSESNDYDTEVKRVEFPYDVEVVSVETSQGETPAGDNPVVSFFPSGKMMNNTNITLSTLTSSCGGTADSNVLAAIEMQTESFDGNRFYYLVNIKQNGTSTVCGSLTNDFSSDGKVLY